MPMLPFVSQYLLRLTLLGIIFLIASCAHNKSVEGTFNVKDATWTGRISLRTSGNALQAKRQFAAGFTLTGSAQAGQLTLETPLGSTLAVARWQDNSALLMQGNEVHTYAHMDELTAALTGNPVPLAALFDWLHGRATQLDGWTPNLTQWAQGRIGATLHAPSGDTELRVVLDNSNP